MNWLDNLPSLALALLLGYLLGSFPTGYLVGKIWGVDVREHGSGRTGGTNVWRASGNVLPALLTVLGDTLKGAVAVLVARSFLEPAEASAALAGFAAVIGHIWPVFLGFKGGAGGATTAIAWIALNPLVGLANLILSLYVLFMGRFASLGTLTVGVGGILFGAFLWRVRPDLIDPWQLGFALFTTIAIVITLQPNLRRLREGTESRITLW